jgi:hypothetical protein
MHTLCIPYSDLGEARSTAGRRERATHDQGNEVTAEYVLILTTSKEAGKPCPPATWVPGPLAGVRPSPRRAGLIHCSPGSWSAVRDHFLITLGRRASVPDLLQAARARCPARGSGMDVHDPWGGSVAVRHYRRFHGVSSTLSFCESDRLVLSLPMLRAAKEVLCPIPLTGDAERTMKQGG